MDCNEFNLKEIENIALQREEQWHSAATLQIKTLQKALQLKTDQHDDLSIKFSQIKEDFKYNLKLLQERDRELKRTDEQHKSLKVNESKLLCEISDLRIKADSINEAFCMEKQVRDEMEIHYKQRLVDQQTQLEVLRNSKNKEIEEMLSELRKIKHQYEHKITALECELESQKVDFTHEMENVMKGKENEQLENEEKNKNECMVLEMKNKLLHKEIEICQEKEKEQRQVAESASKKAEDLQNKLQKVEWDLSDMSSMKNARILELESQVDHLRKSAKKIEEEFEQRRKHLDKDIRSKQANLIAAKQNGLDREKGYEEHIRKLQGELETSKLETNRAIWDHNEMKVKLNEEIEHHRAEIATLTERLELAMVDKSKGIVAKDAEVILLKKREDILKAENHRLKSDVENYKKEVSSLVQREESIKQSQLQMKLDLKRKYEDKESSAFAKTEDFASNLVKSRDHAAAEARKLKSDLTELKIVLDAASRDRDAAFLVVRKHNLTSEFENVLQRGDGKDVPTATAPSSYLQDLQQQKDQLKSVIKNMAEDLQDLQANKHQIHEGNPENNDSYTSAVEKENLELKREKRRLQEKLTQSQGTGVAAAPPGETKSQPGEVSLNHPKIQEHIKSLNSKIATLESEKIDFRAQLQKLQAHLDHQLLVAQQQTQEAKAYSTKLQQLEYEATATKHRSDQEIKRLKEEISNLSLRFQEARCEADEYYRGGIQNNMRAMELSEKVSQMTVDIASDTPWVASSVQAKLVQDLQNEVTRLKKNFDQAHHPLPPPSGAHQSVDATTSVLQRKLHSANERIRTLVHERTMLLESGNKMRAEVHQLKDAAKEHKENTAIERESGDGKLDKMEKLQYELTKQELAFAQRFNLPQTESSSPETSSTDQLPHDVAGPLTSSTIGSGIERPVMMSSIDDASMKEVWKMLEQAPSSPSIASEEIPLRPKVLPFVRKETSSRAIRHPVSSPVKGKTKQRSKVRNYNVKDDKAFQTKKS